MCAIPSISNRGRAALDTIDASGWTGFAVVRERDSEQLFVSVDLKAERAIGRAKAFAQSYQSTSRETLLIVRLSLTAESAGHQVLHAE